MKIRQKQVYEIDGELLENKKDAERYFFKRTMERIVDKCKSYTHNVHNIDLKASSIDIIEYLKKSIKDLNREFINS